MNLVDKTGISFESGQGISARQLNTMNNAINALVDRVNFLLLGLYDINREIEDYERVFNLGEAIAIVMQNRRALGMKIRFKTESGLYAEYSYIGETVNDSDFKEPTNWISGVEIVDGGTF